MILVHIITEYELFLNVLDQISRDRCGVLLLQLERRRFEDVPHLLHLYVLLGPLVLFSVGLMLGLEVEEGFHLLYRELLRDQLVS
jgi:hypothetical protein